MNGSLASPSPAATPGSLHGPVKRRRAHHKTKTGCTDCRRRRVKCDEKKPSCRACVRRRVPCNYTVEGRVVTDASLELPPTPYTAASRLSSHLPSPPQRPFTEPPLTAATPAHPQGHSAHSSTFSTEDLALHHHWTVSTSLSIAREPSCADIWQRVFPEVGFHHPFVTHAILSLAALHLAHSSSSSRRHAGEGTRESDAYVARAAEYHNAGLRGFRQSVADGIAEANSEALFVWSLLNMIYVFGMFRCQAPRNAPRAKDLVLGVEWIPMTRGIEAVLAPTHNHLRFGRMRRLVSVGNWDELEPGPPAGSSSRGGRVDACLCRARETWTDQNGGSDAAAETYDEALRILRKCRMYIEQFETMDAATLAEWGYNRAWAGPLMFVHFVPHAYFTLLHQRQPPALVLFAYFGALLHGVDDFWYMEGLGKEIVEVVGDLLGSYWRPWISWPLEFVGLD
ncbi:sterol uptake control protein 2-like protein 1 [Parachaetomium inaequale]|uniref:Sterol uptake control protein 2-like protein 1 n=1 Tax=Parachaetomium inaequale TaxID=2588326 RepID=A0AAN6SR70_9PEZI|nr:sterol uptake control protein 2-like protein 1 [Parachaetomium inaequale]